MSHAGFGPIDSLGGTYALVVDGDAQRRSLVTGILRYCGALVTPADSPKAALAVMELVRPDVVLIDLSNSEDGGFALIRAIRALAPEQGGSVSAVGVGDDESGAADAVSLGFDVYVVKPLEPWDLCRVILRLINP